ncbi:MAG TPA: ATP-binding protein [Syntrophomonadaceae bacterium]|nr:ATP-binding protein [Syntrophomonadaceae bacterium]
MKRVDEIICSLKKIIEVREKSPHEEGQDYFKCSLCRDRGLIFKGDVVRVCPCVKQHYLELRYQYANITPEIKDYSFESFRLDYYQGGYRKQANAALEGARQFVNDYLENPHTRGLLFTGDVGAGKTYLAGAIANSLLKKNVRVLFLVVPDFLDELRATYNKGNTGEGYEPDDVSLLRGVRQVDVLILDDLGVHNYTPWTCNKLYSLLNYRLNYQLPVIITTNLSLGQLDQFLGERTTSRIVQMCRIYEIHVTKDIRHQKNLHGLQNK